MTTVLTGAPHSDRPAHRPAHRPADLLRATLREHVGTSPHRLVVVGLSRDERPKATVVALGPSDARPRLVAKVAMVPGAVPAVVAEAAALAGVARLAPDLVGGTVPRLLDARYAGESAVLVTSVVPGVPMSVAYHRWRHTARPATVRGDLAVAVAWLRELARVPLPDASTRNAAGPGVPTGPHTVSARLRARWPADAMASAVADAIEALAPVLALSPGLPTTVVHGDFWCGNVLRTGDRATGVVDWEHAELGGDPLRDVTRFVVAYLLYLDRHTAPGHRVPGHPGLVAGSWGAPVRFAVEGTGWLCELVRAVVADELRRTGRDPGQWREALALATAEVAAVTDEPEFARRHLLLTAELLRCC